MKQGNNYFTVLATDISGAGMTAVTSGSWSLYGEIEGTSFSTIDEIVEITGGPNGFYRFDIDIPNIGQGFLQISNTNPNMSVTPTFFDLDIQLHDIEDVYSQVITTNYEGITTTLQFYESINIESIKEGDDVQFTVAISDSITTSLVGWTDFKMSLREAGSVSSSGAEFYIGDVTIENINTTENTVSILIPYTLTQGIIPEGSQSVVVYGDLQAENPSGKRKTLAELQATVVRQFTTG
jgi:hypothetical protein